MRRRQRPRPSRPPGLTVFLAATATKVSVYVLLRFVFTVFGVRFAFETMPLDAFVCGVRFA